MSAWDNEIVPPRLKALGQGVRSSFGLVATAIGHKGDEFHDFGYHRSRNWINVDGAGRDDYSNQLQADLGGNGDWVCALDATLSPALMIAATGRLITAMRNRDPRVAQVREVYGTTDGRTVTGWDAATMRWITADASHLWHLHVSLYRSRADDDHSGLRAVIIGEEDDMAWTDRMDQYRDYATAMREIHAATHSTINDSKSGVAPRVARMASTLDSMALQLTAVLQAQGVSQADLDELQARPAVLLTAAQIAELAGQLAAQTNPAVIEGVLVDVLGRTGLSVRDAD